MFRPQTELFSAAAQRSQNCIDVDYLQLKFAPGTGTPVSTPLCCVGCFQLMPVPEPPIGISGNNMELSGPEPLCVSCFHRLSCKNYKSIVSLSGQSGELSPLPKLSLLVKAEAKCQDQLQLLQSQQQILDQQKESLQATKRAKEEALAVERKLARRRRKHFLMIQESRKREEELRLQQFLEGENTNRSEQEGAANKKLKTPKVKKPPQRRKSEPAVELSDVELPQVTKPVRKHSEAVHSTTRNDSCSSRATNPSERRKQVLACYSQDLSPLVEGRKPGRLPFSKPVAAVCSSSTTKRRQTRDNGVRERAGAASMHNKNMLKDQSFKRKTIKLHPLAWNE